MPVWSKAPKHKFKGPKAVEMAAMSTVLQFDRGQKGRHDVMKLAEIPTGILKKPVKRKTRKGYMVPLAGSK